MGVKLSLLTGLIVHVIIVVIVIHLNRGSGSWLLLKDYGMIIVVPVGVDLVVRIIFTHFVDLVVG